MSRPPESLPGPLRSGPFAVSQARDLGIGTGRLRHTRLFVPTRGVRSAAPLVTARDTAEGFAAGVAAPFAFSHLTAAHLLGMPLPRPMGVGDPVHLMRPTDLSQSRREGVISHRGLERRRVMRAGRLPVVGPLDTWCDLSGWVAGDELVVVGDWLLSRGVRLEDLTATVTARRGERGLRAVRAALPQVRVGSASRMETLARLVFVRAGLPEPELNADVHDDAGLWILRADFLWREQRVVGEYQGDQHRADRRQWQFDIARKRLAEDNRWIVIDLTAQDLFHDYHRGQLIARLGRLLG